MTGSSGNHIEARMGDVQGQVIVGDGNVQLQLTLEHGNVILPQPADKRPQVRPLPRPVRPSVRPFPALLDRQVEARTATSALRAFLPVDLYGQAGLGRSVLSRHLAHSDLGDHFPDGVVYLQTRRRTLDDLLVSIFDAFYESDIPYKPSRGRIQRALADVRALIILDDLELTREETDDLLNTAPNAAFLLVSADRLLWGEGEALALGGLPADDALALLERELGRPISPDEQAQARGLWESLDGHPLRLMQGGSLVREGSLTLSGLVEHLKTGLPFDSLLARFASNLPESERRVLAVLTALNGAPVRPEHMDALAGTQGSAASLRQLEARRLVGVGENGYDAAESLGSELRGQWGEGLIPVKERALAYYTSWAEKHRADTNRLAQNLEPILELIEWAAGSGRWKQVLRLVSAVQGALLLAGLWGISSQVLQLAVSAAATLGDQAAQAWALHQLGTQAASVADAGGAQEFLQQALHIREAIGDQAGAALTRGNMGAVPGGAPPAPAPQVPSPPAAEVVSTPGPPPSSGLSLPFGASPTLVTAVGAGAVGVIMVVFGALAVVSGLGGDTAEASLLLLLDNSNSMEDDGKLGQAIRSAQESIDGLSSNTEVAVMLFPGERQCGTQVVQDFTLDHDAAKEAVAQIGLGPGTPLGKAIREGTRYLQRNASAEETWAMVLLTDGEENCFGRPVEQAAELAQMDGPDASLFVVGFDIEPETEAEDVLKEVASEGGGRYYPAQNEEELVEAVDKAVSAATGPGLGQLLLLGSCLMALIVPMAGAGIYLYRRRQALAENPILSRITGYVRRG